METLHLRFCCSSLKNFLGSIPKRIASLSALNCLSSNNFINIKYVNCSITDKGFVIPPVQNISHILSILFFSSPVIIIFFPLYFFIIIICYRNNNITLINVLNSSLMENLLLPTILYCSFISSVKIRFSISFKSIPRTLSMKRNIACSETITLFPSFNLFNSSFNCH